MPVVVKLDVSDLLTNEGKYEVVVSDELHVVDSIYDNIKVGINQSSKTKTNLYLKKKDKKECTIDVEIPDVVYQIGKILKTPVKIKYKSNKTSVAMVTHFGEVGAKGKGKATITITVNVGNVELFYKQQITVK